MNLDEFSLLLDYDVLRMFMYGVLCKLSFQEHVEALQEAAEKEKPDKAEIAAECSRLHIGRYRLFMFCCGLFVSHYLDLFPRIPQVLFKTCRIL